MRPTIVSVTRPATSEMVRPAVSGLQPSQTSVAPTHVKKGSFPPVSAMNRLDGLSWTWIVQAA